MLSKAVICLIISSLIFQSLVISTVNSSYNGLSTTDPENGDNRDLTNPIFELFITKYFLNIYLKAYVKQLNGIWLIIGCYKLDYILFSNILKLMLTIFKC